MCLAKKQNKAQTTKCYPYGKSLNINDVVGENIDTYLTNGKISQVSKMPGSH